MIPRTNQKGIDGIDREVRDMLSSAGFRLVRKTKHAVFHRAEDDATIFVSSSPRDVDQQRNHVRQDIARADRRRGLKKRP